MTGNRKFSSVKIVVLPGLDGMGCLRTDFCTALSSSFEVSVIDYPVKLVRYEQLRNWVEGRLPLQDYVLVAESFSGPLAIQLAAESPERLKGVVFVASFAKAPRKLPVKALGLLRLVPFHLRFCSQIAQPLLMGRWRNAAFTRRFHETVKTVPVATIRGRIRELLVTDCTAALGRIDTPYVYIGASQDWPVPPQAADDFSKGAQSVQLVGGPHFLLQAVPDVMAEHLAAFVNSLPQRRNRAL